MPIHVDLTGISTELEVIPPGYVLAQVSGCNQVLARSSGKPTINWEFTIQDPEAYAGRKAFYNTSLQPQALWNLKRVLTALGWPEDDLEGELDFDEEDTLGMECILEIEEDIYEGRTVSRVARVLSSDADVEIGVADVGGTDTDEVPF